MHPEKVDSAWRPELSEMVVRLVRSDEQDRKSTRLNSSHSQISYAVFCLKKKKNTSSLSSCLSRSRIFRSSLWATMTGLTVSPGVLDCTRLNSGPFVILTSFIILANKQR